MTSYQVNASNGNSNLEIAHSNQELIMEKRNGKKKKIIILSLVAAAIVIGVIIALVVVFTGRGSDSSDSTSAPAVSLEEILYGSLSVGDFNATWVSGNQLLYRNKDGDILLRNVNTSSTRTLLRGNSTVLSTTLDYFLSPDGNYLLISHDYRKLYRYSYLAQYSIVNINTQEIKLVNVSGETLLQIAAWGPIGNSLVFVMRNNLFYRQSADSTEDITLTTDGALETIYNGVPDWVYEEEVLSSNKAFWFSPDGTKLAYAKFDDTNVPLMTIPVYGIPGSLAFQYTRAVQIRYPKAGTINPTVTLHAVDLANNFTEINLNPPSELINVNNILSAVAWATNSTVSAIWMNRVQNYAEIVTYTISGLASSLQTIIALNQSTGWVELFSPPVFSSDGTQMAVILSQDQGGDLGSYKHLTLFDIAQNSAGVALTNGTFVVKDILSWDSSNNLIYFTSNVENDPAQQHVYSVSTSSREKTCLSCDLKHTLSNANCLFNSADFSKDHSVYAIKCQGPDVPEVILRGGDHQTIAVWDNNEEIYSTLKGKALPTIQRMSFDVDNGFKAQVLLRLPPNLDTSGNTKYPMVVYVYGGPDSFQVSEKYTMEWGSYLASNKSIIYAVIDGRGSGLKGDKMLFTLYRSLGTVEVADQINVTRQIQESLPYVDASRTAIWGWSYGGYASAMALATDTEGVFKCGMSVAPVTDWTLYDSVYTERFMGLPTTSDNIKGYETSLLLSKYEGIKGKDYFLVHGTLDDNVHYQQSMFWAKVLEQQDILFRQMSYPDEDHGLSSVRPHLYHSLENFLDECFSIES